MSASADPAEEPLAPAPPGGGAVARNTAIFSIATGISRIAGLVREISVASFFGTSGPFSAFTIARAASDMGISMRSSWSERLRRAKWRRWSIMQPPLTSQTS